MLPAAHAVGTGAHQKRRTNSTCQPHPTSASRATCTIENSQEQSWWKIVGGADRGSLTRTPLSPQQSKTGKRDKPNQRHSPQGWAEWSCCLTSEVSIIITLQGGGGRINWETRVNDVKGKSGSASQLGGLGGQIPAERTPAMGFGGMPQAAGALTACRCLGARPPRALDQQQSAFRSYHPPVMTAKP